MQDVDQESEFRRQMEVLSNEDCGFAIFWILEWGFWIAEFGMKKSRRQNSGVWSKETQAGKPASWQAVKLEIGNKSKTRMSSAQNWTESGDAHTAGTGRQKKATL